MNQPFRAVILAAGKGSRLGPLTLSKPKCLVEVGGGTILSRQLGTLESCGASDISVISGHFGHKILDARVRNVPNPRFAEMNMVGTLFNSGELERDDLDIVVSYGDIVYGTRVLNPLLSSEQDVSVVVDKDWLEIWSERMANPLEDAETLLLSDDGRITDLGKVPKSIEEIQGQYIGLFKISKSAVQSFSSVWRELDRRRDYDGQDFMNMYMTAYLRELINRGWALEAVPIRGGWFEFDTPEDIATFQRLEASGKLRL